MRRGRPPYPDLLTPREQEVLQLLREGLTNQQIADRLGIGVYGARYHVSEILSKLGVGSRDEAAEWRGERVWALGGIGAFLLNLKGLRLEGIMKATSIAALAGAGGLGVLLVAGVLLTLSSGAGDSTGPSSQSEATSPSGPDGGQDLQAQMPEYREYGPYRVAPEDYEGDVSKTPSPVFPPSSEHGAVAENVEQARASSLFPKVIPDGYSVVEADSDGQPSELFLRMVMDGPSGRIEVEQARPWEVPIDVRYDPATEYVQFTFLGRSTGAFALIPVGGDETTPGAYVRGAQDGIDTVLTGPDLTLEQAREFYRAMNGEMGPATAERLLPDLVRTADSLPRSEDITVTGPCDMDVIVTPHYVWKTAAIEVNARVACEDLVPLTPCDPGYVYTVPGLTVGCDASGYRIDTTWAVNVEGNACEGHGTAFVEGTTLLSTHDCSPSVGGSGTSAPIEVCVSIRDQETCASFVYVVP